ncbi:MAG TPA: hypothetical protein VMS43_08510 [Allosphingosinicella sp.]|nr:hypothetical protein [Allosphingosinicella sp.]
MRSILSKATTGAMIAGAALFVAACGGGAANNAANASNGTAVGNEPAPMDNTTTGMSENTPAPMDGNAPAPVDGGNTAEGNTTNNM